MPPPTIERQAHPLISLIPTALWKQGVRGLFKEEISGIELTLLEGRLDKHLLVCFNGQNTIAQLKFWLCVLLSKAEYSAEELLTLAQKLNIPLQTNFKGAALAHRVDLLSLLKEKTTGVRGFRNKLRITQAIKEDHFNLCQQLCILGYVDLLQVICNLASLKMPQMINLFRQEKFNSTDTPYNKSRELKHLTKLLHWLKKRDPEQFPPQLTTFTLTFFSQFVREPNCLCLLKWLQQVASPAQWQLLINEFTEIDESIDFINNHDLPVMARLLYDIYRIPPQHLETLLWFREQTPERWNQIIRYHDYSLLRNSNRAVIQYLLSIPECFHFAITTHRLSNAWRSNHIAEFITKKLFSLKTRSGEHPKQSIFLLQNNEETELCFYMLIQMIHANNPVLYRDINFLLSIPEVSKWKSTDPRIIQLLFTNKPNVGVESTRPSALSRLSKTKLGNLIIYQLLKIPALQLGILNSHEMDFFPNDNEIPSTTTIISTPYWVNLYRWMLGLQDILDESPHIALPSSLKSIQEALEATTVNQRDFRRYQTRQLRLQHFEPSKEILNEKKPTNLWFNEEAEYDRLKSFLSLLTEKMDAQNLSNLCALFIECFLIQIPLELIQNQSTQCLILISSLFDVDPKNALALYATDVVTNLLTVGGAKALPLKFPLVRYYLFDATECFKHIDNPLGLTSLFTLHLEDDARITAYLIWLVRQGLNNADILQNPLLHQRFLLACGDEEALKGLYQLLDCYYETKTLAETARKTAVADRGFCGYALDGQRQKNENTILLQISTHPKYNETPLSLSPEHSFPLLYKLFSEHYLINYLKFYNQISTENSKAKPIHLTKLQKNINNRSLISLQDISNLLTVAANDYPQLLASLCEILLADTIMACDKCGSTIAESIYHLIPYNFQIHHKINKAQLYQYIVQHDETEQEAKKRITLLTNLIKAYHYFQIWDMVLLILDTSLMILMTFPSCLNSEVLLILKPYVESFPQFIIKHSVLISQNYKLTLIKSTSQQPFTKDCLNIMSDLWIQIIRQKSVCEDLGCSNQLSPMGFWDNLPQDKYCLYESIILALMDYLALSSETTPPETIIIAALRIIAPLPARDANEESVSLKTLAHLLIHINDPLLINGIHQLLRDTPSGNTTNWAQKLFEKHPTILDLAHIKRTLGHLQTPQTNQLDHSRQSYRFFEAEQAIDTTPANSPPNSQNTLGNVPEVFLNII